MKKSKDQIGLHYKFGTHYSTLNKMAYPIFLCELCAGFLIVFHPRVNLVKLLYRFSQHMRPLCFFLFRSYLIFWERDETVA